LEKLPQEEFEKIRQKNGGTLPAWFDPDKMEPLKPQQVAWWDETHRKCIIGGQRAGATHYVRFPRTPEGKLDLEAGNFDDSEVAWVNVKYEKEVRLCLGCGIYEEEDGTTVGVCAKPFCYSGKLLVSLKDDRKNVVVEIARVKSLSHPGPWLADTREDGQVFEHDKTSKLKGIGAKSEEKLSKHGITIVKALHDISPEKSREISDAAREVRISDSQLTKFNFFAKDAEPGDPPEKKDYRKFDNPYKEIWGRMARADSSNFPNEPLRMCHQNDRAHCCRISIDVQGDKVRGFMGFLPRCPVIDDGKRDRCVGEGEGFP
jgi:hypothetical protein